MRGTRASATAAGGEHQIRDRAEPTREANSLHRQGIEAMGEETMDKKVSLIPQPYPTTLMPFIT